MSEYYLAEMFETFDGGRERVVDNKGRHRFGSAFNYNAVTNEHELRVEFVRALNSFEKVDLVNKMYSFYNKSRSPYVHVGDDFSSVKIVNSNLEVKMVLEAAFELFDNYYTYFV